MSKDFQLDENGDLMLVNNDLAFTSGIESTKQKLKNAFYLIKGEWFLDANAGFPYYEEVFGKGRDLSRIEALVIRQIQAIEEVREIEKLEINLNSATRKLDVSLELRDSENNLIEIDLDGV